jgi:hypothetical protein
MNAIRSSLRPQIAWVARLGSLQVAGTKTLQSCATALLSRGSRVRVAAAHDFLENSRISHAEIFAGEASSNKVISLASSRQNSHISRSPFFCAFSALVSFCAWKVFRARIVITGLVSRRSLYDSPLTWHRVPVVTPLRELRRAADLSQQACAALVDVPLNTFRMWDSGLRRVPPHMLQRAKEAVIVHARNAELVSLDQSLPGAVVRRRTSAHRELLRDFRNSALHTIVLTPTDAEAPNRSERESRGNAVGRHKCEEVTGSRRPLAIS